MAANPATTRATSLTRAPKPRAITPPTITFSRPRSEDLCPVSCATTHSWSCRPRYSLRYAFHSTSGLQDSIHGKPSRAGERKRGKDNDEQECSHGKEIERLTEIEASAKCPPPAQRHASRGQASTKAERNQGSANGQQYRPGTTRMKHCMLQHEEQSGSCPNAQAQSQQPSIRISFE